MPPVAVIIKELHFGWHPNQPVLSIPDMTITCGQQVYIKGPSGSGKSTLLSILSGIQTGYTGRVDILDQSMSQLSLFQRDKF